MLRLLWNIGGGFLNSWSFHLEWKSDISSHDKLIIDCWSSWISYKSFVFYDSLKGTKDTKDNTVLNITFEAVDIRSNDVKNRSVVFSEFSPHGELKDWIQIVSVADSIEF